MPSARGFDVLRSVRTARPRAPESPIRKRLRAEALALAEHGSLVEAAYSYRIVPLERPASDALCLDGEIIEAPWLVPTSGELTAVACGVATIGPALEARVREMFASRRAALAVALDELGNELLFAVARRIQDRMLADTKKRGLMMAGELRSGDPGLALETQSAVLRLADADAIGVTLSGGFLMRPLKSTSMVLGVGLGLPAVSWSRCDYCPSLERCRVAQAGAAATS
jgi:hypothetical protein